MRAQGTGTPSFSAWLQGPRVLLLLVGLVVVLVSLPLLQSVALKENEVDAMRALKLLGAALQGPEVHAADGSTDLSALVGPSTPLGKRLPDAHLVNDGRLLLNHGYLFELLPSPQGGQHVRAWPMAHGETGLGVFLLGDDGEIVGNSNAQAQWSGLESAPPWPSDPETTTQHWQRVELGTSQRPPTF